MTTFYMDYEGGSDASAGTSFALRWKTFASGATAARTAPGDTIRIMASPDATDTGVNGTWTDGPLQASRSIVSSTNATPIVITLGSGDYTAMAPAVGDTVVVNGHTTNTNANGIWEISAVNGSTTVTLVNADGSNSVGNGVGGATGLIRKLNNCRVKLASALTSNVALCGNQGTKTNWTASANVTCTVITTDFKEGGESQQIAVASGFTTGLAAYFPITSLDLSAKQQVSFWIEQTAGTIGAANATSVVLCTDALGLVAAHTINIPALGALGSWAQISFDNGGNLNAAILSVAFYINTDNGAQNFVLDNITSSKAASAADSLKLASLISKNTGDEVWYGIQSINGTRVMLDTHTNMIPASSPQRGYSGTTETVTLYKRETIKKTMVGSGSVEATQEAGTLGNLITYSGGWNRTDMSTQTGETWWDGRNGLGTGVAVNHAYVLVDKLNVTRYSLGVSLGAANASIGTAQACNCTSTGIALGANNCTATTISGVCGSSAPISSAGNSCVVGTISRASGSTGDGVNITGFNCFIGAISQASNNSSDGVDVAMGTTIGSLVAKGNAAYAVNVTADRDVKILGGSSSGNTTGSMSITTGTLTLRNFTISESTEVSTQTAYNDSRVYSEKHDGTAGNTQIFCDGGKIITQGSLVHGSATLAWKFSPTSANRSATYPLNLVIAKIACAASALVTVTAWFRRDSTSLTGKLLCRGGQIAGVASDVSDTMTAAIDTWDERTITFTPSEAGVVEIEGLFYGGTTLNGYISDMTISQA